LRPKLMSLGLGLFCYEYMLLPFGRHRLRIVSKSVCFMDVHHGPSTGHRLLLYFVFSIVKKGDFPPKTFFTCLAAKATCELI
jgi:hypothetical protein